jgi:EmrB/QacA subfamily drug resistance transporter
MTRHQRLTLIGAILGSAVVTVDGSIVNVALPAIEQDLGGGLSAQQWVVNAYLLTLASLILIGGSLGDIYGERRVFELGLIAFGACSLACALAPDVEVLIVARALQGAAGALVTPSSLAIIVAAFGPSERGAAIGSWTAWGGISAVVGPLAGGLIVDRVSWRWVFAVNLPLVMMTLPLIRSAVAPSTRLEHRQVDYVGAGLCSLGLAGFVFALIEQPHYGWTSAVILVPLVGGVVALGLFIAHERRTSAPMLKLELFARRNFAVGNAETLAMYAGIGILFFYLVIYLQQVAGYTALESGLATLPVTLLMFVLSRRFGALADRYGPRFFMGAGPLVAAAGIFLLLGVGMRPSYVGEVLPAMVVFSLGLSLTVAPLVATVLADADESDAGIASAINNAVARVAGLVGVSVVGVVIAETLVGDTFAANSESVQAFHQVVLICGLLVAAGGVVGAVGITNPTRAVDAEQCPGGQLVGAPLPAVAALAHPPRAVAASAARES